MRQMFAVLTVALVLSLSSGIALAQSAQVDSSSSVPRLITITGVFRPADGRPVNPVETVTLSVYTDQEGSTPIWQETQSVKLDDRGRYSLQLGATHAEGIPGAVFASGAQWLGTVFERPGEVEGLRVRLTSVPYALRAADADTLGGRPASDYVVAPSTGSRASRATGAQDSSAAAPAGELPGTANAVAKYVDASNVGPSGIVENGGFVGIGTSTPFDNLHVRFTNTNGGVTGFAVQNLGNTATSYSGMLFYDQNGALGQFQGFNNATHEYRINNIAQNGSINFMIGSSSTFFVDSNGRIGIGTTVPGASLDISKAGGSLVRTTAFATGPTASGFFARTARGTPAAPVAVILGDLLGVFGAIGYDGAFFPSTPNADIGLIAAEGWTPSAHGTAIVFNTTPTGTINETLFTMSILPNGNVGIGTPRDVITGLPTATDKLQVFGDVRVGTTATNGCIKDFSGTGIVGTCSSDRRLKKNITPFGSVLNQVTALQPVHYFWRSSEFPDRHFGNSQNYGLIAQDVEQILPELVATDSDGFKAIDYSKLPLLTIQAVKELKAENDALKEEVAELKRLMNQLLAKDRH